MKIGGIKKCTGCQEGIWIPGPRLPLGKETVLYSWDRTEAKKKSHAVRTNGHSTVVVPLNLRHHQNRREMRYSTV